MPHRSCVSSLYTSLCQQSIHQQPKSPVWPRNQDCITAYLPPLLSPLSISHNDKTIYLNHLSAPTTKVAQYIIYLHRSCVNTCWESLTSHSFHKFPFKVPASCCQQAATFFLWNSDENAVSY